MGEVIDNENKRKHLDMIQGVINRMASNSFLFKGWAITLIAAISAFAASDSNPVLMVIPVVSTVLFWAVDAYYLMLERAFRKLYDHVAGLPPESIDFKMDIQDRGIKFTDWLKALRRPILATFYGIVLVMLVVLIIIIINVSIEVIIL